VKAGKLDLAQLVGDSLEFVGVERVTEADRERAVALRHGLARAVELLRSGRQPSPTAGTGAPVWQLVVDDMHARDAIGRQRYGVPLRAFNGRDALRDAYEEALDLAVYLRQAIEERKNGNT